MKSFLLKRSQGLTSVDMAGAGIAAALVLAFIFGLLGPLALRKHQAAAQRESAARQQQRLNGMAAATRSFSAEVDLIKSRLAAAPLHVLPPSALNRRLAAILLAAEESGLLIDDLRPGPVVRGGRFAAIPIALTGHAGYREAHKFVHLLHDGFADIAVCDFRLAAPTQPGSAGTCTFDLQWLTALPNIHQQVAATE